MCWLFNQPLQTSASSAIKMGILVSTWRCLQSTETLACRNVSVHLSGTPPSSVSESPLPQTQVRSSWFLYNRSPPALFDSGDAILHSKCRHRCVWPCASPLLKNILLAFHWEQNKIPVESRWLCKAPRTLTSEPPAVSSLPALCTHIYPSSTCTHTLTYVVACIHTHCRLGRQSYSHVQTHGEQASWVLLVKWYSLLKIALLWSLPDLQEDVKQFSSTPPQHHDSIHPVPNPLGHTRWLMGLLLLLSHVSRVRLCATP